MSGGSWNYLYSKEIDDIMQYSNIELLKRTECCFSRLYVILIAMAIKQFKQKFYLAKMIMQKQKAKVII